MTKKLLFYRPSLAMLRTVQGSVIMYQIMRAVSMANEVIRSGGLRSHTRLPVSSTLNIILPLQNVPVNLISLELAPTYTLNVPAGTFHA